MGCRSIFLAAVGLAVLGGTAVPAAVSVYLSPEELSARAPLIVEADVIASRSGLNRQTGALNTYVTLAVRQVHRGPAELTELVVREPGGRWGDVVHEIDAVPVYREGERVFAYLEPAADGALRTVGMFFGKFRLEDDTVRGPLAAHRDLDGQGTILGRSSRAESLIRDDLAALAAAVPLRRQPTRATGKRDRDNSPTMPAWTSRPPEWSRLEWAAAPGQHFDLAVGSPASPGVDIAERLDQNDQPQFVPLAPSSPTRWLQADGGFSVVVHVEPAGNPLNDDAAAVHEITRALDVWTDVPESRLQLVPGNTNYAYTPSYASPVSNYTGINIVLFDDPYDDISDPTGCGGVLAVGGYWRSSSNSSTVNNVTFHPAMQLYVIFNNNFECFLSYPDNLAEVAAHEIGHGIGFGHSSVTDALMRSAAYGGRGPRLGSDDIDAAHCHYPHSLTLTRPNGGESWTAGSFETVEWNTTNEVGPDPGIVDLEYSTDGGNLWKTIASGTANDGSHTWNVPDESGAGALLRVVRPTGGTLGLPYPADSCSEGRSDASFTMLAGVPSAGSVGGSLALTKSGSDLSLTWNASCSAGASDYAIYAGDLDVLRSGGWDHAPLTCSTGSDLHSDLLPARASRYYLVAARTGNAEGSLGDGRPTATSACAPPEADSCSP